MSSARRAAGSKSISPGSACCDLARQHLKKARLAAAAQESSLMLSDIESIKASLPATS
jgi:hypothetical protein